MREIKFRGLRTDGNGCVYGYYWFDNHNKKHKITSDLSDDNFRCYEVAPETVGQFTGLTDKNGKEIYFDDLAICNGETYKIVLEELGGAVKAININKSDDWHFLLNCNSKIEVIGNIHDTNNQHII